MRGVDQIRDISAHIGEPDVGDRALEEELAGDARRERVQALRQRVASGRYRIDQRAVAGALCEYIIGLNEPARSRS